MLTVAPLGVDGRDAGFVCVILLGEERAASAPRMAADSVRRTKRCAGAMVVALGMVAGLVDFQRVTRPVRGLKAEVNRFHANRGTGRDRRASEPHEPLEVHDEIATLRLKADVRSEA